MKATLVALVLIRTITERTYYSVYYAVGSESLISSSEGHRLISTIGGRYVIALVKTNPKLQ